MPATLRFLVCSALCLTLITAARAEIPPLPKEAMEREADLVITGQVTKVEAKVVKSTSDGFRETRHLLTIDVATAEKGKVPDGRRTVVAVGQSYVLPAGNVGTAGIRSDNTNDYIDDVREGWELKLYLKGGKDGVYYIVAPNGFAVLKKPETKNP